MVITEQAQKFHKKYAPPTEEMENGTPFGHPRTAEPPPLPGQQSPKLYPRPSDTSYLKRFNKS